MAKLIRSLFLSFLYDFNKKHINYPIYYEHYFGKWVFFVYLSGGKESNYNTKALIKLFDKHPLIEREFSFQSEVNDLLRAAKHPGIEVINELRDLARDEGLSNIGISLTDPD